MPVTKQAVYARIRGDAAINFIIGVNVCLYIISLIVDPSNIRLSANPLDAFAPSTNSLLLLGATGTIPIDQMGRFWSVITANYLHGSLLHIVLNMIAFKQLAPIVATIYGVHRMFIIYTLGGIVGFWLSYLAGIQLTIGASASICGLVGAIFYFGKSHGGNLGDMLYRQTAKWIVGMFIIGLMIPVINNWGHGGGIIGGVAAGFLFGYQAVNRENRFHRGLAYALAAITLLILLYAVVVTGVSLLRYH